MRFLVDVNLSVEVARWLRGQGHDAIHLDEVGLSRLPDEEIVARAAAEGRIVVTRDLDFGAIVTGAGAHPVSVVTFRLTSGRPARVIPRLDRALRDHASALAAGAVVVVEEARFRVRHLPSRP
ncbi:MAG TPA: DUF5615 family PIN-like protein [Geminicoccaceae bacterium]|nr:DUF5615 family PIN-like protein [Geminicoccaceae bacterium]